MTSTPSVQSTPPRPARQRGSVACRRCRRQRAKCHHQGARPPCQRCVLAGSDTAASCSFPSRGERDTDRTFRNPRHVPGNLHLPGSRLSITSDIPLTRHENQIRLDATPSRIMSRAPQPHESPSVPVQHDSHQPPIPTTSSPPPHAALQNHTPSAPPPIPDVNHRPAVSCHSSIKDPGQHHGTTLATADTGDHDWPPHAEVVEGCRTFVTCYFQLGFLPKAIFLEKLTTQDSSSSSSSTYTSRFLLCCILSISSRFTPSLVCRYGSKAAATDHFLHLAQRMVPFEMYRPSTERIQAFFLLSIAEWGNGDRDRSAMDMGVAVRQAVVLKLHREETYCLPPTATADAIVQAESARRTFWMIHSQENLHSGTTSPAPVPLEDITALLPCHETGFDFGEVPESRAALAGTAAARDHPELVFLPERCLFATLVQAHSLWGHVARHAATSSGHHGSASPWDKGSTFASITTSLRVWETKLPARHRWSLWNLRGWKAKGLHLAYLSVVMVLRLSNIVARRIYVDQMIEALSHPASDETSIAVSTTSVSQATPPAAQRDAAASPYSTVLPLPCIPAVPSTPTNTLNKSPPAGFWQQTSHILFDNVVELHEQVMAYFHIRGPDEGFPVILVFCVYVCGSLASTLWRNPCLCPHVTPAEAEDMAMSTLRILGELYQAWPVSARWQQVLRHVTVAETGPEGGLRQEKSDNNPSITMSSQADAEIGAAVAGSAAGAVDGCGPSDDAEKATEADASWSRSSTSNTSQNEEPKETLSTSHSGMLMADFPDELFSAELAEYLEGSVHYGPFDGLYFKQ